MKIPEKAKIIIEGLVATLFVIILFADFSSTISDEALERNQKLLKELSLRSAKTLRDKIDADERLLQGIAKNISQADMLRSQTTVNRLSIMAQQTDFTRIIMITEDFKIHTNGNIYDAPINDEWLERAIVKEKIISGIFRSQIDGKQSIAIIVPTYDQNNQFIGLICGVKHIEQWSKLIDYTSQYDEIYFHVIDEQGNFVIRSSNKNVVEEQQLLKEYFGQALEKEQAVQTKEINAQKNGVMAVKMSENTTYDDTQLEKIRYISFAPIGINDWYMVALVPQEFVSSQSERINNLGKELLLKVVGVFFILMIMITKQMNDKTKFITLSKERYRIAVEKSDTIIFDYNVEEDIMYGLKQVEKNFSLPADRILRIYTICHPDDTALVKKFVQEFSRQKEEMSVECRLKYRDGEYKWNKFSLIPLFDNGNLIDAIGILEDIAELKEVAERLLQVEQYSKVLQVQAERDYLTGLYNKGATEDLISKILQESEVFLRKEAFIIIDLDNFKAINDNFGHAVGDELLQKVARHLTEIFRETDIVGRIGGDEFMVLLREPKQIGTLAKKMQEVCDKLIFVYTKEGIEYKVSASVGAAIYPEHGKTFIELYNQADKALYDVKRNKKGVFGICEG